MFLNLVEILFPLFPYLFLFPFSTFLLHTSSIQATFPITTISFDSTFRFLLSSFLNAFPRSSTSSKRHLSHVACQLRIARQIHLIACFCTRPSPLPRLLAPNQVRNATKPARTRGYFRR
jgi:hypothetical protein